MFKIFYLILAWVNEGPPESRLNMKLDVVKLMKQVTSSAVLTTAIEE